MNKATADPVRRKLTPDERTIQEETLEKYRNQNIIPSLERMRTKTATSMNTCVAFMHGNSTNEKIMAYVRLVLDKNLRPIPEDVKALYAIWDSLDKV